MARRWIAASSPGRAGLRALERSAAMAESDAMLDAGLNRGECDRHDVPPAPSVVLGRVEGVTTPPRGPSPGPPPPPVGPCAEECLVGEE